VCHTDELTQPKPPSCSIDYILLLLSPSRRPEKAKRERHTHTWTSISPTHMCVLLLLRRPKNYITHKSVWGDLSIIYRRQYKYIAGNLIDITTINGKPPLSFLVYEKPFISPLASILISGKHLQGFSCKYLSFFFSFIYLS
jgi:hypothetical protein